MPAPEAQREPDQEAEDDERAGDDEEVEERDCLPREHVLDVVERAVSPTAPGSISSVVSVR